MLVIRQIWFIGLVSLVSLTCLVSCGGGSDDDLLAPQPGATVPGGNIMTPITFGGKETEETSVTRAGTPLYEKNITTFKAWGYKDMSYNEGTKTYYDNQPVMVTFTVNYKENSANTTASNTNGWEYVNQQPGVKDVVQSIKYWDWDAKAYRFFAVTGWGGNSPKNLATPAPLEPYTTYYDSSTSTEYKISMLADASSKTEMDKTPYFSHLWFSNGVPMDYPDKQFGQPVTLEFLKPYARVRFIFKYTYPRMGIELTDPSFKPTDGSNIALKGTVTVLYPLTGSETQESFSLSDVDAVTALTDFTEDFDPENDTKVYSETDKGWYMVLPNIEQGSYTMSVYINDPSKANPPKTAVVPAKLMQWFPGYSYTYVFKITEEGGIEIGGVEYAVTPWTDIFEDRNVYNW